MENRTTRKKRSSRSDCCVININVKHISTNKWIIAHWFDWEKKLNFIGRIIDKIIPNTIFTDTGLNNNRKGDRHYEQHFSHNFSYLTIKQLKR